MYKKSLMLVLSSYIIWGFLPIYWGFLAGFSPLFVLANRIVCSALFTFLLLLLTKGQKKLFAVLKDRQAMKYLVPAAVIVTFNWGLYIWAVINGRVLDASLGYFINPLAVFLCGVVIFKESFRKTELAALLLAAAGVLVCTLQVGEFPFVALALAFTFSFYSIMKKLVHDVDALVGVCVETLLITPAALLFLLLSPATVPSFSAATPVEIALIAGSGIVTALPLALYAQGFRHLSMITMGLLQFVLPTLMFFVSIANGEDVLSRLGGFAFIWAGLIVFIADLIRRERKAQLAAAKTADVPNP